MTCDQCAWATINGHFCHEAGCPNVHKTWIDGEWVRFVDCDICGHPVPVAETCSCESKED
ncbi:MAG: hypothetical protein MUP41_09475 [Desulfobacterales bacterium]|nr:hypothetical protein [Desulfobacterales bacterium]